MQSFLFFRMLGKWLMLSVSLMSFSAMAQELQLDELYRTLTAHPMVKIVL